MLQRDFQTVSGRAIDNQDTKNRHQIISSSYDPKHKFGMLHYTVYAPKPSYEDVGLFSDNIKDILSKKDTIQNAENLSQLHTSFSKITSAIVEKKQDRKKGFILNQPSRAITCDIKFDENYIIKFVGLRQTLGLMTDKMSYDDAKKHLLEDDELALWSDVFSANFSKKQRNPNEIDFQKITQHVGHLMQTKMREYAVNNNIPCVYRIDKRQDNTDKSYTIHSNTLNYFKDAKEHGISVQKSVVPSTSSRMTLARINLLAISNYMETEKILFPAETVDMIAHYKNMTRKQSLLSA